MSLASSANTITHVVPFADAMGAFCIGVVHIWVALPLAVVTGKILIQIMPPELSAWVLRVCSEVWHTP
jgi:hypothetical protein